MGVREIERDTGMCRYYPLKMAIFLNTDIPTLHYFSVK